MQILVRVLPNLVHFECLKYLHEKGCPWDWRTCSYAAWNGHLECLKYAREKGRRWDEMTCLNAASNGHLECLKYARENGCPGSSHHADAVFHGYV